MDKLYTISKNKTGRWLWLRSWTPIGKVRLKLKKIGKSTRPFSSVQSLSRVQLFAIPWTAARQTSLSIPSPTPRVYSNSCHWVGDAIQPSHPLLSPSSPAFNPSQHQGLSRSQFFPSDGQSIRVSAPASILSMNTQDWSPLGWTGWISLQ